jgi:lipopolysaccharide/colanic/teichoic acid biosynthesis glycosyltransferase
MPEGTGGGRREGLRRTLNVFVAVLAIILTSPLWALIALAIKVTSPGPVFFRQLRVGIDRRRARADPDDGRRKRDLGGRPFEILKFRTMIVDAERATGPVWSSRGDTRVTPVGQFLRSSRLDELPQLVNVLRGDMNVVGPRPERPQFFAALRAQIPRYQERQRVRPGITGHAQVTFEADSSLEDVRRKVRYDLEYLDCASVGADLRIMTLTLPVLLFRRTVLHASCRIGGPSITPVPGRGGGGAGLPGEGVLAPEAVPMAAITDDLHPERRDRFA